MRYVVFVVIVVFVFIVFSSEIAICHSVRNKDFALNNIFSRTAFCSFHIPGLHSFLVHPGLFRFCPFRATNEKAAYRVPISRFLFIIYNDSYFLPRYCEKFLCHHQIVEIEFIISFAYKNKKPAFEEQAILF